jgi:hypothetical protein
MSAPLSNKLDWNLANPLWAATLNPVIANPILSGLEIKNVVLNPVTGITIINHNLGRNMQGWFVTDINASVTVYRSQPFNNKTLTLTSSGGATINLWVY